MKNPVLRIIVAMLLVFLAGFVIPMLMIVGLGLVDYVERYPAIHGTFMFVASLLFALALSKGKLVEYGFKWSRAFPLKKIIFISISIGFLSTFFTDVILKISAANTPWEHWTTIDYIINTWIVASIGEETLTRGLAQSFLAPLKHRGLQLFGYRLSLPVIAAAVFFSLMHLVLLTMGADVSLVAVILLMALTLGLMAGYHREKTGSLIPAIIIHTCFNIGAYLLTLFV